MTRPELHNVRRPFFDCTSRLRLAKDKRVTTVLMHLHAELSRPLPEPGMRYSDIKVAARLGA